MRVLEAIQNVAVQIDGRVLRTARLKDENYSFLDEPMEFSKALKAHRSRIDLFTFVGRLPDGGAPRPVHTEMDNFAVLPITTFEDWWDNKLDKKTRNMARKGTKAGVEVRETVLDDELVAGISGIYNESQFRQGRKFWHYGKDLDAVRRDNGTLSERSIFIGAYLLGELIGYVRLIVDETGRQAGMVAILSMMKHRDKAPTNALIAEAVRVSVARGIRYMWYGNFVYGNKGPDTLTDFKSHNGFERFDIPRYYVPLTWLGQAAIQYGLHKPMIERVPASLIERFRGMREKWYGRELLSWAWQKKGTEAGGAN